MLGSKGTSERKFLSTIFEFRIARLVSFKDLTIMPTCKFWMRTHCSCSLLGWSFLRESRDPGSLLFGHEDSIVTPMVQRLAPQRLKVSEARPVEESGFELLARTPASVTCKIQQSPQQASLTEGEGGLQDKMISLALCHFRR